MKKTIAKKLVSILFLSIFLSKMVISVAPLIIVHLDPEAVNAVIMQLEIEHPKSSDAKECGSKEYITLNALCLTLPSPVWILRPATVSTDHDKHVQAFFPSVPTPPPNA